MIKLTADAVIEIYETVLEDGSFIGNLDDRIVVIPNDTFNPYVWDGKYWYVDREIKVDISIV